MDEGGSSSFFLPWFVSILLKYLLWQAVVGALLFEWCWYSTRQYRTKNEKRDGKFPEFRRLDNVQGWTKSMFYPGAVLLMPTRALSFIFILIVDASIC